MLYKENNLISLPFSKILSNVYWKDQAVNDIKEATGIEISPTNPFRIYKIWIPNHSTSYVQTCIFQAQIGRDMKAKMKAPAGKFANRLQWVSEAELQKSYRSDSLCSHVLLELYPKIVTEKCSDYRLFPIDVIVFSSLVEVGEDSLVGSNNNSYDLTAEASGLKPLQNALYKEFMTMASPNFVLAPAPFCKFLTELGMSKEDTGQIFRAADLTNRKFLSFREFFYILAVLEPLTNHNGISGEIRCRYIFRFFDKDRDGVINSKELKEMIIYMRTTKNLPIDAANVDKELRAYACILNVTLYKGLNLADFLTFSEELKIPGLSKILRLPRTIKIYMQSLMNKEEKMSVDKMLSMENAPTKPTYKIGDFEIAPHTVHIRKSGSMINIQDNWSIKGVSSMTNLQQESPKLSYDINPQECVCNDLIKTVKSLITLNQAENGKVPYPQSINNFNSRCNSTPQQARYNPAFHQPSFQNFGPQQSFQYPQQQQFPNQFNQYQFPMPQQANYQFANQFATPPSMMQATQLPANQFAMNQFPQGSFPKQQLQGVPISFYNRSSQQWEVGNKQLKGALNTQNGSLNTQNGSTTPPSTVSTNTKQ